MTMVMQERRGLMKMARAKRQNAMIFLIDRSEVDRHSASGGRPLSNSPRERQVAERPLVVLGVERARAS